MSDDITRREPLDPDTGPRRHLRPVLLVAVGGAIGTAARYLLATVIPDWAGIPIGIIVINLAGALLLGWLITALAQRGPDVGARQDARLLVGTGMLGGFTTYSALATDTAILLYNAPVAAILYSIGTLALGAAATGAGIALGRCIPPARAGRT